MRASIKTNFLGFMGRAGVRWLVVRFLVLFFFCAFCAFLRPLVFYMNAPNPDAPKLK
jgi:hypothetical protein